jgi:D-proline reductase (dithiol) PrdB
MKGKTQMHKETHIRRGNRLRELLVRWADDSQLGQSFAYWIGKTVGGVQLRLQFKMDAEIPWTPLNKPLSQSTVALVTTGGVHCCSDSSFNMKSDATYRLIPRSVSSDQLCISHDHYDRRDAARDINLVFPLERLLELEQEAVIGRVADIQYGFGFTENPLDLISPGRKVGLLLKNSGVDMVLLVPA